MSVSGGIVGRLRSFEVKRFVDKMLCSLSVAMLTDMARRLLSMGGTNCSLRTTT